MSLLSYTGTKSLEIQAKDMHYRSPRSDYKAESKASLDFRQDDVL